MDHTPDPAANDGAGSPREHHHDVEVQVRRSPKYGRFMALGAALGAVVAWIVAWVMPPAVNAAGERVDTSPIIGLSIVVGFVLGGALGAVVALLIDRSLAKRAGTATAEQIDVSEADAPADAAPPAPHAPHAPVVEAEFEHHRSLDEPAAPPAPGETDEADDERDGPRGA
ncbi:YtxH domain-containing protein [Agrococcus carbonis]|nr:YtxH domain-containing protein [Agrococcus carbonis]